MEQDVKAAARRLIAKMSHMSTRGEAPVDDVSHFQNLQAQLVLAQLALTYPQAVLGTCAQDGAPMHFVAGEDGLCICCTADPSHSYKVGSAL